VLGVLSCCSGEVGAVKYFLAVVLAVPAAAAVGVVARCSWLKVGLCDGAGFAETA